MAPFKMPFSSRKSVPNGNAEPVNDENAPPNTTGSPYKPSLALGVKEKRGEPNEFKLSSVNDSGEYLPPSPTEKKSYWSKSPNIPSSNHRSVLNENEPFSISRESFESYRRSFDISGRSPITHSDSYTSRTSFDSRLSSRLPPRSSLSNDTFADPRTRPADDFEDVGLNDDPTSKAPKKKGFLSRFADSHDESSTSTSDGKSHHFSLLGGRRRGQSGSGNELNSVERPNSKGKADVAVR